MRAFRFPRIARSPASNRQEYQVTGQDEIDGIVNYDRREDLSRWQLFALSCCTMGLQVVLSLVLSNGTPFLITLGLPDSLTAVVWVVAPLSGVFIQPYIGILSDRCQSALGRRRPFIIAGAAGCVVCILLLASTGTIIHSIWRNFGLNSQSKLPDTLTLVCAILEFMCLYTFIQPLQAGSRSLIIDRCPAHQQSIACAWASRATGVGNILGYLFGFVPVHNILPAFNISQFTWLCIVSSCLLTVTTTITCIVIEEEDARELAEQSHEPSSLMSTIRHIIWSAKAMPRAVQQVCVVQFFAWLGWFPYLFYISSYVGDLYAATLLATERSHQLQDIIIEDAVRLGSLASLMFSVFALLTNIIMPSLIHDPNTTFPPSKVTHPLRRLTMVRAWSLSHSLFGVALLTTLLPQTHISATVLAAFIGISWAFTLWAPYAIIGCELARSHERGRKALEGELDLEPIRQDQAGAIMGLHNCAISTPQVLAATVCSCIFWAFPKIGISDSIGWVLRFGSIGGFIASWLAARMEA